MYEPSYGSQSSEGVTHRGFFLNHPPAAALVHISINDLHLGSKLGARPLPLWPRKLRRELLRVGLSGRFSRSAGGKVTARRCPRPRGAEPPTPGHRGARVPRQVALLLNGGARRGGGRLPGSGAARARCGEGPSAGEPAASPAAPRHRGRAGGLLLSRFFFF